MSPSFAVCLSLVCNHYTHTSCSQFRVGRLYPVRTLVHDITVHVRGVQVVGLAEVVCGRRMSFRCPRNIETPCFFPPTSRDQRVCRVSLVWSLVPTVSHLQRYCQLYLNSIRKLNATFPPTPSCSRNGFLKRSAGSRGNEMACVQLGE